jgi:hypothetical protein
MIVETVNGCLKRLGLEGKWLFKTLLSLNTHLLSVLTCYAAIQVLNFKQGLKPLTYKRFPS